MDSVQRSGRFLEASLEAHFSHLIDELNPSEGAVGLRTIVAEVLYSDLAQSHILGLNENLTRLGGRLACFGVIIEDEVKLKVAHVSHTYDVAVESILAGLRVLEVLMALSVGQVVVRFSCLAQCLQTTTERGRLRSLALAWGKSGLNRRRLRRDRRKVNVPLANQVTDTILKHLFDPFVHL